MIWFLVGWVLLEIGLWYTTVLLWALGLWKLNRNLRKREELEAARDGALS